MSGFGEARLVAEILKRMSPQLGLVTPFTNQVRKMFGRMVAEPPSPLCSTQSTRGVVQRSRYGEWLLQQARWIAEDLRRRRQRVEGRPGSTK